MAFTFTKSTPANGSVAIFEMKERLKSAGWTVKSSGTGTGFSYFAPTETNFVANDGITHSGSGAGGMANTQAWFRIQAPSGAGGVEFVFQRGTDHLSWRCRRSRSAGFTGGTPDPDEAPSASDVGTMFGGGTDAAPTFITNVFAVDGSYRWNVGADSTAPYGWWASSFATGGSLPQTCFVHEPLTAIDATDADKHMFLVTFTGNNALRRSSLEQTADTQSSTASVMWSSRIAVSPTGYSTWQGSGIEVGGIIYAPGGVATHPISGKDQMFPILWFRPNAIANPGFKGVGTLLKWNGVTRTTGDTLTVSTTRDRIIYGDVSLPWDGSVPTI